MQQSVISQSWPLASPRLDTRRKASKTYLTNPSQHDSTRYDDKCYDLRAVGPHYDKFAEVLPFPARLPQKLSDLSEYVEATCADIGNDHLYLCLENQMRLV